MFLVAKLRREIGSRPCPNLWYILISKLQK